MPALRIAFPSISPFVARDKFNAVAKRICIWSSRPSGGTYVRRGIFVLADYPERGGSSPPRREERRHHVVRVPT